MWLSGNLRMNPGHAFLGRCSGAPMTAALCPRGRNAKAQPMLFNFSFSAFSFYPKGAKGNARAAMADLEMWMG